MTNDLIRLCEQCARDHSEIMAAVKSACKQFGVAAIKSTLRASGKYDAKRLDDVEDLLTKGIQEMVYEARDAARAMCKRPYKEPNPPVVGADPKALKRLGATLMRDFWNRWPVGNKCLGKLGKKELRIESIREINTGRGHTLVGQYYGQLSDLCDEHKNIEDSLSPEEGLKLWHKMSGKRTPPRPRAKAEVAGFVSA